MTASWARSMAGMVGSVRSLVKAEISAGGAPHLVGISFPSAQALRKEVQASVILSLEFSVEW